MAWQAEAGELEGSPHAAVGSTWQAEARGLGLKQRKKIKKIKKKGKAGSNGNCSQTLFRSRPEVEFLEEFRETQPQAHQSHPSSNLCASIVDEDKAYSRRLCSLCAALWHAFSLGWYSVHGSKLVQCAWLKCQMRKMCMLLLLLPVSPYSCTDVWLAWEACSSELGARHLLSQIVSCH